MRLLHTADWHLGRLFHNLSLLDDQRHVLQQLLEIIDREQVDPELISFNNGLLMEEDYDVLLRICARYASDFELIGTDIGSRRTCSTIYI